MSGLGRAQGFCGVGAGCWSTLSRPALPSVDQTTAACHPSWGKEQGEEGWEAAVGWSTEGPSEMPLPESLPGRTAGISSLGPGQVLTNPGFL